LKGVYKTEGEVLNMVLDETGDPALKVRIDGLISDSYTKAQTDSLLSAKQDKSAMAQTIGNLTAPLTHLPMKKNLLTAQGQSIATATRASTATYFNRYGVLKSAVNDVMRFNKEGCLFEGDSTNLLLYSEQFDNAAWVKYQCLISPNEGADVFGTNLADKIVETSSTGYRTVYQPVNVISGTTYTFSIFVSAGERHGLRIYNAALAKGAYFDVQNGTVLSVESGITANIEKYNNTYRCSITYTASTTGAQNHAVALSVNGSITYTGDGVSGLYIFGAQLEAMPFATSYIPTTTAIATRAGNSCSLLQAENIPCYANDFSIVFDAIIKKTANSQYLLGDGIASSGLAISYTPLGLISFRLGADNVINSSASYNNEKVRISIVKTNSLLKLFVNGVLAGSIAALTPPNNPVNLFLG
jgi:hypothetical protein